MDVIKSVDAIMKRWHCDREFVIEMLQDVQSTFRHLPEKALVHLANALDVPLARLYHIGTFYDAFSLTPRGEHTIQVCIGAGCQAKGAQNVLEALAKALDVEVGGTTRDARFTLETVGCLGCCSLAPVVAVDGELHGGVTPDGVPALVKQTSEAPAPEPKAAPAPKKAAAKKPAPKKPALKKPALKKPVPRKPAPKKAAAKPVKKATRPVKKLRKGAR